eukprot:Partr_v1_DN24149_c0_g1_i3_m70946 putative Proteasome maturation protein
MTVEANFKFIPSSNFHSSHAEEEEACTVGHSATAHPDFAVHDTLRSGFQEVRHSLIPGHPLEKHLQSWDDAQTAMKETMHSQIYGLHAPLRIRMEAKVVAGNMKRLSVLPQSHLSRDILLGRDESIDFEDFMSPVHKSELIEMPIHSLAEVELMGLKKAL